ncbi:MAG TPA: hypothetical protein VFB92_26730 [Vicinamibacterales bacterium]|jgi:uncharacterized membrane protein YeaQ/YmgE (transglycosylase-associated protein family)|nr:hypothetical protein [Vicinamibacterales bacterium]
MPRIRTLFLLLTIIGPLHMAEQLLTAIDEFYSIRDLIGGYYAWFDPAAADHATVLLVTIVWTFVSVLFYTLLHDGLPRLIVPAIFGLFGVTEAHHVIESILKGAYDPGVVMSVPYAIVGAMLVAAVWREFKREVTTTDTTFATAHR